VSEPIVVCLGRYGDILNALPIAYSMKERKPKFVVSKEFWQILDGVTYVRPVVWDKDYKELPFAIERTKGHEAYIAQCYKHPDDRRLTASYQKESWRLAGFLDKFGTIPLVFDNRDGQREKEIDLKAALLTNPYSVNKATILVSGTGVSSPFKHDLVGIVRKAFPGYNVVDLNTVRAKRVYDLLGLFDNSALLVTIDTMHLHLARASNIPVVALINDGWYGSVPPPNAKAVLRYSEASGNPSRVIDAIKGVLPIK
jgi:hypothetical protein